MKRRRSSWFEWSLCLILFWKVSTVPQSRCCEIVICRLLSTAIEDPDFLVEKVALRSTADISYRRTWKVPNWARVEYSYQGNILPVRIAFHEKSLSRALQLVVWSEKIGNNPPLLLENSVCCREGLFSRPSQNEQAQVAIDMGSAFDFDSEVDGLRGQVGKLKSVRFCLPVLSWVMNFCWQTDWFSRSHLNARFILHRPMLAVLLSQTSLEQYLVVSC